ncbi:MAG: butyrate kinase [Sporomusaceae bacterium]|nr:butyrate kinase [Sporomusaceae bacterium]
MRQIFSVLAINPGSTSTKLAVFNNLEPVFEQVIRYTSDDLAPFACVIDQLQFRMQGIRQALDEQGIKLSGLAAVVGRGGLLKPIEGGTYAVNAAMLEAMRLAERGEHAANLGAVIARELAAEAGIPAYIVDPVVVDEMAAIARLSGLPGYDRASIFHALNQKAVARRVAAELGKAYEQLNLVVAHLGGGISVGAHQRGRVIDVNDALGGEGPFTPERAGSLPVKQVVELCCCSSYRLDEVKKLLVGQGGLVAYLGTNDGREVVKMIDGGNDKATLVYQAMAYQVAKEIGSAAAVLAGKVNAVILTGGLAHDAMLVQWIAARVNFIAPVKIIPGEDEMIALTEGALRVLRGEEAAKEYR